MDGVAVDPEVELAVEPAVEPAVDPPAVSLVDLGTCEYRKAWALQKELVEDLSAGRPEARNALLTVEHSHVYTLGRRGKGGDNVVAPGEVPVLQVERGGDVTYHGPGQLVAYPILRLVPAWQDIRRYVNALQQALIDTVAAFDITAGLRRGEPGAWVVQDGDGRSHGVPDLDDQPRTTKEEASKEGAKDPSSPTDRTLPPATPAGEPLPEGCRWRKLASVGVAVSRWVTYHGVALNVSTDLSYFDRINPCGFDSATMTSMSQLLGLEVAVAEVKPVLVEALGKHLVASIGK